MTAATTIITAPDIKTEMRARSVMAPMTPRSGNNFRIMGCGLASTFFFAIFLLIAIPFFDDMNYDVTHEHCHNWQKREKRKPVDLRRVIHTHTIAPEGPLSSINIYMLSFKQFLVEKSAAWQRKEGKDPEGGLNKKGVASYRRENPGSKLQTAVTEKPSKLKPGSKKAKRRKSFCSRMQGMKKKLTSKKTANDPNSRINKSLRKWNC